MVARVAVACLVVGGGLVFRDLADDFAGEPGQVLRGAARIAVIGQLRRFPLELTLAVARGGQLGTGQGRSQVGELADETGEYPEHRGKVPAKRHPVLARSGHVPYFGQGPGDRTGPRGQILKGIQHRAVGPRYGSFGFGPQVPPQALPRVPGGQTGLLGRHGQLAVVPWPGLHAGVRFGGSSAQILQGTGDVFAPLPDRMLGRAELQRREHQDVDRHPGRHADADVDHPVRDVGKGLVAAEQQGEQRGEGHLRTLISQPVPAADQHPGYDDNSDARDPRSQQYATGMARAAPSKNPATYWTPSRRERATVG